jgi:hypothetical protein
MSTPPRDLALERINRLTEAVADLMESHAAQGRNLGRTMEMLLKEMTSMRADMQEHSVRLDRIGFRLDRIERRLALTEASSP